MGYDQPIFGRQYTEKVEDERGTHTVLRYDHSTADGRWVPAKLPPGQKLQRPAPLFTKLDEERFAERLESQ